MWADWENGSFALPCGVDFCRGVVEGLIARVDGKPPEALASVTVYCNAGRTLQTLRAAFDDHAARNGPLLLPRLRLVTDLGADLPGAPAAPLGRMLDLGNLVSRVIGVTRRSARAVRPRAARVAGCADGGDAIRGLLCRQPGTIDTREHAAHWRRALTFLKIAAQFPRPIAVDRPARQRVAADARAQWTDGMELPKSPIVAVDSTGSHGATRLFLRAVSSLPLGAVVITAMTSAEQVWQTLEHGEEDHPQARLAALRDGGIRPGATSRQPSAQPAGFAGAAPAGRRPMDVEGRRCPSLSRRRRA